jgi:hypothetical protein
VDGKKFALHALPRKVEGGNRKKYEVHARDVEPVAFGEVGQGLL